MLTVKPWTCVSTNCSTCYMSDWNHIYKRCSKIYKYHLM